MSSPLAVAFVAGATGPWRVERITTLVGEALADAERLDVIEGEGAGPPGACVWRLRGMTTNLRYTTKREAGTLVATQEGLHRPQASRAVLTPIRKTSAWWDLAQDERRVIFEERSRHIAIGMAYLPAIARRLHHSRDLGEPFDFLTWFEYASEHEAAFDEMLAKLRASEEWRYVDREVDIRLTRQ